MHLFSKLLEKRVTRGAREFGKAAGTFGPNNRFPEIGGDQNTDIPAGLQVDFLIGLNFC